MSAARVQVAIIGGGPSGLLLSQLLNRAGIETLGRAGLYSYDSALAPLSGAGRDGHTPAAGSPAPDRTRPDRTTPVCRKLYGVPQFVTLTARLVYSAWSHYFAAMNTRFAVATHILCLLEHFRPSPVDSELIAGSVGTNPVVIRRLLPILSKAGLLRTQLGAGGGALLARPAAEITLLDVYRALSDDFGRFGIHENPNPACPVGRRVSQVLGSEVTQAERVLQAQLASRSIADMMSEIRAEPSALAI